MEEPWDQNRAEKHLHLHFVPPFSVQARIQTALTRKFLQVKTLDQLVIGLTFTIPFLRRYPFKPQPQEALMQMSFHYETMSSIGVGPPLLIWSSYLLTSKKQ